MAFEDETGVQVLRDRQLLLELSLRDLINLRAEEIPEADFLLVPDQEEPLNFHDLRKNCLNIASFLNRHEVEVGETVAMMLPNCMASAMLLLAVMYSGRVLCPLNLVAGDRQLNYVLEHSESRLLLIAPELLKRVESILDGVPKPPSVIEIQPKDVLFTELAGEPENQTKPRAENTALLMYTSGTTGKPKGVLLSHRNLIAGGLNATESHALIQSDRALCVLPLYHINGLVNTLMGPLVSGSSVFMPPKFRSSDFWTWILDQNCTWFSVVPTILSSLLHKTHLSIARKKRLTKQIRFGRSASAPLAPEVHQQFERKFGVRIIETMGLTETSSPILSNPQPPGTIKYGSPGIAWGNEVRIVGDKLDTLPAGREGEIAVRGANVMQGYFKNSKATAQSLQGEWLMTGDLGVMDEDGYVFVRGRTKELIIKGGENIAPREIDEALYEHPVVLEAAAFAVEDPHYGQDVEACVILTDGSSCKEMELITFCEPRLGNFKTPRKIHILSEMPKGPSGKIQRLRLAELTGSDEKG